MGQNRIVRTLVAVMLVAVALGIRADQNSPGPEKPPPGHGKYLIVLWDAGTPVPGHDGEKMKPVPEPDIAQLGGRLLSKNANRRVVFLPAAAAKQLQKHRAVSYIQRIWMGEPLSEWRGNVSDATMLRAGDVAADVSPTFTWDRSYTYDGDGNIVTIGADHFEYDDLGRLVTAWVNDMTQSYLYDSFGNLLNIETIGKTGVSVPVDPSTNRVAGQTYDAAGNMTSRRDGGFTEFDSLNQLVAYGGPQKGSRRILYDANDERIGTIDSVSLQRWTIRDFDGQILREFSGYSEGLGGMVWSWEQDHIRGGGQLVAGETVTWRYNEDPAEPFTYGGKRHYHLDHLGSVRVITNQAGRAIAEHDYAPFGRSITKKTQEQINWSSPRTDGMRFAGHWRDFLSGPALEDDDYIDYMHARYYEPNWGRFLSVDPGKDWDPKQPQSWNTYAYVRNRPTVATDPNGRRVQLIARELNSKVARAGTHTFIVVIPTGANRKQMASRIASGYTGIVLGGYSGEKARGEKTGTLVKRENDPTDVKTAAGTGLPQRASIEIRPPSGMTMEQFERAVIAAFDAYQDTRDYEASPEVWYGEGNCNTFSSGMLVSAGVQPKDLPANLPGVDWGWPDPQPIP